MFFRKLYDKYFGHIQGAAHVCDKPALFWSVYSDEQGWYFSWFNENHSKGVVEGPYNDKAVAELAQQRWIRANSKGHIVLPA